MKVQISYYVGASGILDGNIEIALNNIAADYDGKALSADWATLDDAVYRQVIFDMPGNFVVGGVPGRFCRQACEYLEYLGSKEPKFELVMDNP